MKKRSFYTLPDLLKEPTEPIPLPAIREAVEQAARAMATLPRNQWPGWAMYLLETLDSEMAKQLGGPVEYGRDAQYRLLSAIKDSIEARLETGRW